MKTFSLTIVVTLALIAMSVYAQFARATGFYAIGLKQQQQPVALVQQHLGDDLV